MNAPIDLTDVTVYAIIDEYLKTCKHYCATRHSASGQPAKLSDAEIIFVYLMACLEYGGNLSKAQQAMYRYGNIKATLHKSQYNRRLHHLTNRIHELFGLLSGMAKQANRQYSLDSCPLPVCHNIRIRRCRILQGEQYRGYNASKRVYYYGYKIHLITAVDGSIVEFDFYPASYEDKVAFGLLPFDLPSQAQLCADKAYNYYQREEELLQDAQLNFQVMRKKNAHKLDNTYLHNRLVQLARKHIESTISALESLFPRKIHAVTAQGFLLKAIGFIIAHNLIHYF